MAKLDTDLNLSYWFKLLGLQREGQKRTRPNKLIREPFRIKTNLDFEDFKQKSKIQKVLIGSK